MTGTHANIPLFPLGTVLFPGGLLPLRIFEQRYLEMTKACMRDSSPFGVCLIREGSEVGAPATHEDLGCLARITQWDMQQLGLLQLVAQGGERFRVRAKQIRADGLIIADIEVLPEHADTPIAEKFRACRQLLERIVAEHGERLFAKPFQLDSSAWVSARLTEVLPLPAAARQKLLELDDSTQRLEILQRLLTESARTSNSPRISSSTAVAETGREAVFASIYNWIPAGRSEFLPVRGCINQCQLLAFGECRPITKLDCKKRRPHVVDLDTDIRASLASSVDDVFTNNWRGREREAISVYAFGHLVPRCGDGRVLRSSTQIGIEVAVPQIPGGRAKRQVCKDLVLWSEPGQTCWDEEGQPTICPMAIMEWKANRVSISLDDIRWLKSYSKRKPRFVGFATCVDLKAREFRLACARVESGHTNREWLVL